MIEERYDLAIGRIGRIGGEESVKLPFRKFFQKTASFLLMIDELKKEIESGGMKNGIFQSWKRGMTGCTGTFCRIITVQATEIRFLR